jgi:Ca-activated chloride channel family protein
MSRHALHPTRARRRHPVRVVMAALLTLLVVGAVMIRMDATPSAIRTLAAKAPLVGAECPSDRLPHTAVTITVAPELKTTIERALKPVLTRTLPDRECVRFTVQAQEPAETVQSAAILPVDRAPDIWIPDSSLWESRVPKWQLNQDGSFATSPVVLATSQKAVDALKWKVKNPSWPAALAGVRPLAVPRIAEDAAGLTAVITLWQMLGKGDNAQRALAGTVLAAGRAGVPDEAQAIKAAESGAVSAPLLPTSQQAVTAANQGNGTSKLVAVHPTGGGSPSLDYPVLTMLRSDGGTATLEGAAARERAVRAVVSQLLSSRSAGIAQAAGFDIPESRSEATPSPVKATAAADDGTGSVPSPVVGLAPQELAGLVDRITSLSAPSRFLTIFDLSGSMEGSAGNGQKRIAFAATAAKLAGNLLTDRAQVGLWGFSRDLKGTKDTSRISKDIIEIEAIAELKSGPKSHREQLNSSMDGAGERLGGNGTALFSAAVAGMKEMKGQYDPRAGNAVVLFTDGANSDDGGPTLNKTLAELAKLYDPKKPVRLICIGIGADADMKELRAMSSKAGGQAFLAKSPQQLPAVLFDVMNRRS